MKLLTKEVRKQLPALYSSEDVPAEDKLMVVKFFDPYTSWTWYACEFDGKDRFFGFVVGLESEWGYFSLAELESLRLYGRQRIERDLYFTPKKFSQLGVS